MADRVNWQDLYATAPTALITTIPTFSGSNAGIEGKAGVSGNTALAFLVPQSGDHPDLKPALNTVDLDFATGESVKDSSEYRSTSANIPEVALSMPVSVFTLSYCLGLFLQSGANETDADPQVLTGIKYVVPTVDKFCGIVRSMAAAGTAPNADTESHVYAGAFANTLELTSEEGGVAMINANFMAASHAIASDVTIPASSDWGDLNIAQSYSWSRHEDLLFKVDSTGLLTPNWNITLNNNAIGKFYNANTVQKFLLGKLTGEGSYRIPWGAATIGANVPLQNWTNNTENTFQVYQGSVGAAATDEFSIRLRATPTDNSYTGDDEIGADVVFALVKDATIANGIVATVAYDTGTQRGW